MILLQNTNWFRQDGNNPMESNERWPNSFGQSKNGTFSTSVASRRSFSRNKRIHHPVREYESYYETVTRKDCTTPNGTVVSTILVEIAKKYVFPSSSIFSTYVLYLQRLGTPIPGSETSAWTIVLGFWLIRPIDCPTHETDQNDCCIPKLLLFDFVQMEAVCSITTALSYTANA